MWKRCVVTLFILHHQSILQMCSRTLTNRRGDKSFSKQNTRIQHSELGGVSATFPVCCAKARTGMSTHSSAPMMWSEMGSVHPSLTLCPSSLACSCVLSWNDALGRNVNPGIGPGGHQLKRFFFPPSVLINCKSFVSRELRMRQRDNVLEELSCSAILSLELATELIQQIINLGSSQTCEEELKANLLTLF